MYTNSAKPISVKLMGGCRPFYVVRPFCHSNDDDADLLYPVNFSEKRECVRLCLCWLVTTKWSGGDFCALFP